MHDWFSHGKPAPEEPWEIPVADDDPWPEHPMKIPRTHADPSTDPNQPLTYVTDDTHWWDGSQIYGRDPAFAAALRSGENGKLQIDEQGLPPQELEKHIDLTGVAGNFWVGLALLHSLFMREHNAICDELHERHPELTDQELYDKGRLINAALMAKIHTVDWTPAIIAHPTTVLALRANWWGLEGENLDKRFGRKTANEVIRGIPGSPTDHHGVRYSLTEEFVAVYRMHPLIPDDYSFRSLAKDALLREHTLEDLGALHVRERLDETPMEDLFYSFGISHPGAIALHNYPRFLQTFNRPDGTTIDLAATDVLRTRERGVPRYNQFRRLFHLKPVESFEELTGDPETAEELRAVYDDVERVDHMVGMYAEPKPKGFGFQRHGLPRVHPHGLAPAEERPLLHARLPARGLHADRARLDREQLDALGAPAPLPRPRACAPGRREPVRALAAVDGVKRSDAARFALAAIRIFNGGTALLAPERLDARLGLDRSADYPWRMFGIRTVLMGVDLLSSDPEVRRHALRDSVLVHGSDTISAAKAGYTKALAPRAALTATAISAVNVALALIASRDAWRRGPN